MHHLAIRCVGAAADSGKCIREEHSLLSDFALFLAKIPAMALAIHPNQNAQFLRTLRVAPSQGGP